MIYSDTKLKNCLGIFLYLLKCVFVWWKNASYCASDLYFWTCLFQYSGRSLMLHVHLYMSEGKAKIFLHYFILCINRN